jgi:hypothetical protein
MPIDFPTNPTSGQTYSYNSITWEYNGVAWDKQGGGGSVGPQGNTGATGPQGNTGATGPVGDYVISLRGLTGAVGLTNGSGIGLSVSGQTLTFSNTGVLSFNGLTGAVTGLTTGSIGGTYSSILYKDSSGISGTEYFTISSISGSGFSNDLLTFVGPTGEYGYNTNNGIKIQRWVNGLALDEGGGSIIYAEGYDPGALGAASLWLGARDGSNDDINSSVKIGTYDPAGLAFTDLATFNRIPAGNDYIFLYALTQFQNSVDLLSNGDVSFYDSGNLNRIVFGLSGATLPTTYFVYLPNSNTTLAGLATTQTFTGTNTFNTLTNFGAGISSEGGTFSALTRFTAGISAAGGMTLAGSFQGSTATFSGDIAVNGGDITTTATTASLFNANATTLDILNTQSSGFTLNVGTATSYSGAKNINIGGNLSGAASENIRIGSASSSCRVSILGGITLGGSAAATVRIAAPSDFVVGNFSTFSGLATFNAGISAAGGITFSNNVQANGYILSSNARSWFL